MKLQLLGFIPLFLLLETYLWVFTCAMRKDCQTTSERVTALFGLHLWLGILLTPVILGLQWALH